MSFKITIDWRGSRHKMQNDSRRIGLTLVFVVTVLLTAKPTLGVAASEATKSGNGPQRPGSRAQTLRPGELEMLPVGGSSSVGSSSRMTACESVIAGQAIGLDDSLVYEKRPGEDVEIPIEEQAFQAIAWEVAHQWPGSEIGRFQAVGQGLGAQSVVKLRLPMAFSHPDSDLARETAAHILAGFGRQGRLLINSRIVKAIFSQLIETLGSGPDKQSLEIFPSERENKNLVLYVMKQSDGNAAPDFIRIRYQLEQKIGERGRLEYLISIHSLRLVSAAFMLDLQERAALQSVFDVNSLEELLGGTSEAAPIESLAQHMNEKIFRLGEPVVVRMRRDSGNSGGFRLRDSGPRVAEDEMFFVPSVVLESIRRISRDRGEELARSLFFLSGVTDHSYGFDSASSDKILNSRIGEVFTIAPGTGMVESQIRKGVVEDVGGRRRLRLMRLTDTRWMVLGFI